MIKILDIFNRKKPAKLTTFVIYIGNLLMFGISLEGEISVVCLFLGGGGGGGRGGGYLRAPPPPPS